MNQKIEWPISEVDLIWYLIFGIPNNCVRTVVIKLSTFQVRTMLRSFENNCCLCPSSIR